MTEKTINNIVWWIPFRKLRDSVREVLYSIININNSLEDINKFIIKKYSNESYLYSCKLGGIDFKFYDFIFSTAVNCICNEIDDYNFDSIDFGEFHGTEYKREKLYNYCNKYIKHIEIVYSNDDYSL